MFRLHGPQEPAYGGLREVHRAGARHGDGAMGDDGEPCVGERLVGEPLLGAREGGVHRLADPLWQVLAVALLLPVGVEGGRVQKDEPHTVGDGGLDLLCRPSAVPQNRTRCLGALIERTALPAHFVERTRRDGTCRAESGRGERTQFDPVRAEQRDAVGVGGAHPQGAVPGRGQQDPYDPGAVDRVQAGGGVEAAGPHPHAPPDGGLQGSGGTGAARVGKTPGVADGLQERGARREPFDGLFGQLDLGVDVVAGAPGATQPLEGWPELLSCGEEFAVEPGCVRRGRVGRRPGAREPCVRLVGLLGPGVQLGGGVQGPLRGGVAVGLRVDGETAVPGVVGRRGHHLDADGAVGGQEQRFVLLQVRDAGQAEAVRDVQRPVEQGTAGQYGRVEHGVLRG